MSKEVGNGTNPFVKGLEEKEKAAATATKASQAAQNAWWRASMALRDIEGEARRFPVSARGPIYPKGYHERVDRAMADVNASEQRYEQARTREQEAVRELTRAIAARQRWDEQEARLAHEAEVAAEEDRIARTKLTPKELAIRDARK